MLRFVFDSATSFEKYLACPEPRLEFSKKSEFILSETTLDALRSNHRAAYRPLAAMYKNGAAIFQPDHYENDCVVIRDAIATPDGHILVRGGDATDEVFVNGGCRAQGGPNSLEVGGEYESVITIAAKYAASIWHFPYEALAALKAIPPAVLEQSKIHVSGKSSYISQWCALLNINDSKLVTGNIRADTLYVPRMGRCGMPYCSQMFWLQDIVQRRCGVKTALSRGVLIKRNYKRATAEFNALEKKISRFAEYKNLELYVHDDASLPELIVQQEVFSSAKYVFAPHGAAGVHIAAMNPQAWYVEFLNSYDINLCFARLAYFYDVNYLGATINDDQITPDDLDYCFEQF